MIGVRKKVTIQDIVQHTREGELDMSGLEGVVTLQRVLRDGTVTFEEVPSWLAGFILTNVAEEEPLTASLRVLSGPAWLHTGGSTSEKLFRLAELMYGE